MTDYNLTTKAVNSKTLLSRVREYIEETMEDVSIEWSSDASREALLSIIEDQMELLLFDGLITQWNIMCDFRNNKVRDMEQGKFNLEVSYKQKHCLNTTKLLYKIQNSEEKELTIDLSF